VATRDVAERVREMRFADADGPDDDHVRGALEEAQRDELVPERVIVRDTRGGVPQLELHSGIEPRTLHAQRSGEAVAPRCLIREHDQQEVLVRHLLLPSERESLGERLEDWGELQSPHHRFQIR
jgi:hypothetical protein